MNLIEAGLLNYYILTLQGITLGVKVMIWPFRQRQLCHQRFLPALFRSIWTLSMQGFRWKVSNMNGQNN